MAATVTSAWAKPGAWALDAEESEAGNAPPAQPETSDFPSLATSISAKVSKKKKKSITLAELTTGQAIGPGAGKIRSEATRLTTDELLHLPTGPRERTAEELERGSSYRGFNQSSFGTREPRGSEDPRRGRVERGDAGGFREPPPPSRADEIDDWGAMKKSSFLPPPVERRERGGGGGGGGGFFDSRADGSDNWTSNKGSAPAPPLNGRRAEGLRERRVAFESHREGIGGAEADSWGKRREEPAATASRPRLTLQPRSLPLESNVSGGEQLQVGKPKGANPFGAARPREEVLAEKGQDWKKIDEKLENMRIREPSPIVREGSGFGRRGSSGSEELMERRWRKDDSAASPPASESSEPAE